jgi:VanZ family protein
MMKRWAFLFGLFIITIIILADKSQLGFLYFLYDFPNGDKVGHFILFGILSLLANLSVFEARPNADRKRLAVLTSLILAVFIGAEEYSQRFFSTRTSDIFDLAASYLGVTFFAWLAVRLKK